MASGAELDSRLTGDLDHHQWTITVETDGGHERTDIIYNCVDPCDDPVKPGGGICICGWINDFPLDVVIRNLPVRLSMDGSTDETNNPISGHEHAEPGFIFASAPKP